MQITRSSIPWSTIIPISFDDRRELSLFCKERCSFKTLFLSLNIVYLIIYENFLILMSECLRELEELLIFSSFELDESDWVSIENQFFFFALNFSVSGEG